MTSRTALRSVLATIAALTMAACASSSQGAGSQTTRPDPNRIGPEEIAAVDAADAFQIVQRLRPRMLQPQAAGTRLSGSGSSTSGAAGGTTAGSAPSSSASRGAAVQVYVDDQHLGGAETLRTIPKTEIAEIRYYSAREAGARFGTGADGGVIQVRRRTP